MLDAYVENWAEAIASTDRSILPDEVRFHIEIYLRDAGPDFQGWLAYTERRFIDALRLYGSALGLSRDRGSIRAQLAHIHCLVGDHANAERELKASLAELRRLKDDELVYVYDSRASYEYALGVILETGGRTDAALEAYGRALVEDPYFHPAHARTAGIALADGDTAAALNALALATSIESVDAGTRLTYGRLLAAAGQPEQASGSSRQRSAPSRGSPSRTPFSAWRWSRSAARPTRCARTPTSSPMRPRPIPSGPS